MRDLHSTKASLARPYCSMSNAFTQFTQNHQPEKPFLTSAGGEVLATYADFETETGRYLDALSTLGIKPGDRVAVQVEKSPQVLFLYFACLRGGIIYLALNTAYQKEEIRYFIEDAEPALFVADPAKATEAAALGAKLVHTMDRDGTGSLRDLASRSASSDHVEPVSVDDTAVILYTSGTTGRPKGAMITHGNIVSNTRTLCQAWQWSSTDVMLHALPIFHVHGLFVGTHLPVMEGSSIIFLPQFQPAEVLNQLPNATVFMGVPTYYTRLLDAGISQSHTATMRLFTSGSAPLLPQTFAAFEEATGHTIVERYGMTETGMNTSNPISGPRKPGTVGLPLEGVLYRIVDDEGSPVGRMTPGNLQVKGPNVLKGYWRKPEQTAASFSEDGYFDTGDIAETDEDGYVKIVGREKDLIISGGLNVYPIEVETVINRDPGVVESAVIGVPHADFGEAVIAVIVCSDQSQLAPESLIEHLKASIANFKVPKRIIIVDQLPRNTMGKVQKNALRAQYEKLFDETA
ncbi:MAG: AMP-binding protein [Pseudomonadales bacterium]